MAEAAPAPTRNPKRKPIMYHVIWKWAWEEGTVRSTHHMETVLAVDAAAAIRKVRAEIQAENDEARSNIHIVSVTPAG